MTTPPMRLGVNLRPLVPTKIGGMESYARNVLAQVLQRDVSALAAVRVFTAPHNHDLLQFDDPRVEKVRIGGDGAVRHMLSDIWRTGIDALFCPLVALEPTDALVPSFVTIPDLQHEAHPEFFEARTLAALREVYPASVRLASGVFTISEFSRRALADTYGVEIARITVVPLDVADAFRSRRSVEERRAVRRRYGVPDRYILYPAITWPHKNHVAVLRALRSLTVRSARPLAAVFTGSAGPAHADVVREIDALGLNGQVFVLGHVLERDLACLYQDAVALVFPSLFEGFGLPILEAFHCDCPVICSSTTSCPETAGDAALYVDPNDPASIAAALEDLEGTEGLRERLIGQGHERAARFSWTRAGALTWETLSAAVDAARRPVSVSAVSPMITVVTPSFNHAQFIAETIDSVLAQDYPHLDYIVIDGGSTDGTQEILRGYGDRLRWVSEPDRGQADAVNKGVRLGHGEIIGWLNSDDTYMPGALQTVARAFAMRDDLAVVYGDADHVLVDGRPHAAYPTAPFDYDRLAESCFICQPAAFFRRKAFDEVGGLDPDLHYCMDYDLWIRMGRLQRFAYVPEVLARSRLHKDAKTFASRRKVFQEIIRTVRRQYGFIPFEWTYGYADYLFNRSGRDVFSAKRPSALAFGAGVVLGIWFNRGRPRYWTAQVRRALARVSHTLPLPRDGFEGRWDDGWISRRYVSRVPIAENEGHIRIQGRHLKPGARPLTLSVLVNGISSGTYMLHRKGPFSLEVACPRTERGTVDVEIVADTAFRPLYRGLRDGRLLSCIIDDIRAH